MKMSGVRHRRSVRSIMILAVAGAFFLPSMLMWHQPFDRQPTATGANAEAARTPSPYIGSIMALLATFQDAGILPPEGTSQANGIIKAVIQFQSAFQIGRAHV